MKHRLLFLWFTLCISPAYAQFFSSIIELEDSSHFYGHQFGDMNQDGLEDIVFVLRKGVADHEIYWLQNLGDYNFVKRRIIYDPILPKYINTVRIGDFNSDGINDLVFIESDSLRMNHELLMLPNPGVNSFNTPSIIRSFQTPSGTWMYPLEILDFDSDGQLDVISVVDRIWLSQHTGTGTSWTHSALPDTFSTISPIGFGDFNGDQNIDLIFINTLFQLTTYFGNGSGGVSSILTSPQNFNQAIYGSRVEDFNNDSIPDILIAYADEIIICLNSANGIFNTMPISMDSCGFVCMRDMNSDGEKDFVKIRNSTLSFHPVFNGTIDPNYQVVAQLSPAIPSNSGVAIDKGSDGDLDVIGRPMGDFILYENVNQQQYRYNGEFYYDRNQNKIRDHGEELLPGFRANLKRSVIGPNLFSSSAIIGKFRLPSDSGMHSITYSPENYFQHHGIWNLTTDSIQYTLETSLNNPVYDSLDFGFFPSVLTSIVGLDIVGSRARCNSNANIWLNLKNLGTTNCEGILSLVLDDSIQFVSSQVPPDSTFGNQFFWKIDSLPFGPDYKLQIETRMPGFINIGRSMKSWVRFIEKNPNGILPYSVSDTLSQIHSCAYDPNDKQVLPTGRGANGIISQNQELKYTIRFQNTGNDTAIHVVIQDHLNQNLNPGSARFISSSHPVTMHRKSNGQIVFRFENINLPDSGTNKMLSQGYVQFSIFPRPNLDANTIILNRADIFFDSNPPILTNAVKNTIGCDSIPSHTITLIGSNLYTLPGIFYNHKWYRNDTLILGANSSLYSPNLPGIYTHEGRDSISCWSKSLPYYYFTTGLSEKTKTQFSLYPNPSNGQIFIVSTQQGTQLKEAAIRSFSGQVLRRIQTPSNAISVEDFPTGIYLLELQWDRGIQVLKFIKD